MPNVAMRPVRPKTRYVLYTDTWEVERDAFCRVSRTPEFLANSGALISGAGSASLFLIVFDFFEVGVDDVFAAIIFGICFGSGRPLSLC